MGKVTLEQLMGDLNQYLSYVSETGTYADRTTLQVMLENIYDAYVKEQEDSKASISLSDLSNTFIPCTEADVNEVFSMLNSLWYTTKGLSHPEWTPMCTGVRIYSDKTYQCFYNHHDDLKEISLEDFRSKFLEWINS